jgi:hypothetical protein
LLFGQIGRHSEIVVTPSKEEMLEKEGPEGPPDSPLLDHAKRIEAGREAMIAGLCESPLTFQAIILWRDELNEGKVLLRDIVDVDATYAGPSRSLSVGAGAPSRAPNPEPAADAGQRLPSISFPRSCGPPAIELPGQSDNTPLEISTDRVTLL